MIGIRTWHIIEEKSKNLTNSPVYKIFPLQELHEMKVHLSFQNRNESKTDLNGLLHKKRISTNISLFSRQWDNFLSNIEINTGTAK